ncbi:MAG: MliC family protein [bacterium]|nr:MliC family protein [bacterium]
MIRRQITGLALLLLVACTPQRQAPILAQPPMLPQPVGQTFVYECAVGDSSFIFSMKTGPGEIALWLPWRFQRPHLVLGQVRAASGARYEGGGVTVWTKGEEALVEVEGETFRGCRHNRRLSIWEHAKLSGVDFRAVGNEPGWNLEIRRQDRLTFVYDYGDQRLVTPCPDPATDAAARRSIYHAATEAHELTVTLEYGPCVDTMSDEIFETKVTVDLDGTTFRGCGRALH